MIDERTKNKDKNPKPKSKWLLYKHIFQQLRPKYTKLANLAINICIDLSMYIHDVWCIHTELHSLHVYLRSTSTAQKWSVFKTKSHTHTASPNRNNESYVSISESIRITLNACSCCCCCSHDTISAINLPLLLLLLSFNRLKWVFFPLSGN